MKRLFAIAFAALFVAGNVFAAQKKAPAKKPQKAQQKTAAVAQKPPAPPKGYIGKIPYIGAIAVDAESGKVLFEQNADVPGYPASTLKLMTLLVVTDLIEQGKVHTTDTCTVSARAAKTGGSQVYLDPRETFPLDDLLYALMIQSANDAAVAIAEHCAGSVEEFVALMNKKAKAIGMEDSIFRSPHGLPVNISKGEKPDVSTARDMAKLCRELCKHPSVFQYTSADYRQLTSPFRKQPFDMRTHNPFLKNKTPGCDGFKTGFTSQAGWSIAVTAKRNDHRVIVYVLGAGPWSAPHGRKNRDAEAAKILAQAFNSYND